MAYSVKEIFYTLQGEGANAGRASVFCRFSGCNLWSGREEDRATAICNFCDTDFRGINGISGGVFQTAEDLARSVEVCWNKISDNTNARFVVFTGGEPLLQVDDELLEAFHARKFLVAVETNGTISPPEGIDWICVSPKADTEIVIKKGNELKFVFPQDEVQPEDFQELDFDNFFLQPKDGPDQEVNIQKTVDYVRKNPMWRLSLQTHKIIGIP